MSIINKFAEELARRKIIDGYPIRKDEYGHYIWFEDCVKIYVRITAKVEIHDDLIWINSTYTNTHIRRCVPIGNEVRYMTGPISRHGIDMWIGVEYSRILFSDRLLVKIRYGC